MARALGRAGRMGDGVTKVVTPPQDVEILLGAP